MTVLFKSIGEKDEKIFTNSFFVAYAILFAY